MKFFKLPVLVLAVASLGHACREDRTIYDSGQKSRLIITDNDTTTTRIYSLVFELSDQESFLYEIPVSIMGLPAGIDAVFEVELLRDTISDWTVGDDQRKVVNGQEGVDFEIGDLIIEEGKTSGTIPVRVYRKDYMADNYVSVLLRIRENDNYRPLTDDCFRLLIADGEPTCPQWWADMGMAPGWCTYLGQFSPEKYRKLLSIYWETEQNNPIFYYEIFDKYGRYLSDTWIDDQGQTQQTTPMFFLYDGRRSIWVSLILQPLCDYYKEYYASLPAGSPVEYITTLPGVAGDYWRDPVILL